MLGRLRNPQTAGEDKGNPLSPSLFLFVSPCVHPPTLSVRLSPGELRNSGWEICSGSHYTINSRKCYLINAPGNIYYIARDREGGRRVLASRNRATYLASRQLSLSSSAFAARVNFMIYIISSHQNNRIHSVVRDFDLFCDLVK